VRYNFTVVCVIEKFEKWGVVRDMKLKIAVFDPYMFALEGICDSLKKVSDFILVGAYTQEDALLQCLRDNQTDVVVLDLMLRTVHGFELIEQVKNIQSDIKMVVLTDAEKEITYRRAWEMGVNASLQKDTSYSELISCIRSVAKGNDILPNFLFNKTVDNILTETETQVLRRIADEYTNDKIAQELFISRRTVETHVANICRKLDVDSRIGAVREAIRLKLI
jgi:two-component system vancomycin resistance associated response regulator VraR